MPSPLHVAATAARYEDLARAAAASGRHRTGRRRRLRLALRRRGSRRGT